MDKGNHPFWPGKQCDIWDHMGQVVMSTMAGMEKVRLSRDPLVVCPAESDKTTEQAR